MHAAIKCTVAWRKVKEGEEARKQNYSDVKCSIVKCSFSVNASCFIKCICMQRKNYPIHDKSMLFFSIESKVTTLCKKHAQICNNVFSPLVFLSRSAACQQTSSMLTGHLQKPKLDLATNSSEKHFECKIYSCWI
jgi:hypothetical protein